jgi:hypothetical protein
MRGVISEINREFAADRIKRCLDQKLEYQSAIKRVVILAGSEEKPLYELWVAWLADQGVEVEVLVDYGPENSRLFPASKRLSERMGKKIASISKAERWHDALFTAKQTPDGPKITISRAPDPLAECEWALRACQAKISSGTMPSRLCIYARSSDSYGPLLKAAALRLGIPLDAKVNVPLLTTGFARSIVTMLKALFGNDVRALGKAARSSSFGVGAEGQAALWTLLSEACRDKETQWETVEAWCQEREDFAWLYEALVWRAEAVDLEAPLSVWAQRLVDFFATSSIVDLSNDSPAAHSRDVRAQTTLQSSVAAFASISDSLSARDLRCRNFLALAESIWEEALVEAPGDAFGVQFMTRTESLPNSELLCVLGMLEGVLPRRRSENAILFDSDLAEISELSRGRFDLPNSFDRAAKERDEFVRICAATSSEVIFSYPETSDDRDNVPAFYLKELERAGGPLVEHVQHSRLNTAPPQEECKSPADDKLRKAMDGPRVWPEDPSLTTGEALDLVRRDPADGVRPNEVEAILTCPFRAMAIYRLNLKPPHRRRLMSLIAGIAQDANLPSAKTPEEARTRLKTQADETLDGLFPDLESWELKLLDSAADRLIEDWVQREFAARSLWPREGTALPVSIGEEGLRADVPNKDLPILLTGNAAGKHAMEPFDVVQLFVPSLPERMEPADDPDNFPLWLVPFGLWMMSMRGGQSQYPALEVDSLKGERFFLTIQTPEGTRLQARVQDGLYKKEISLVSQPNFFRGVKNRLTEAADLLNSGETNVRPGEACRTCSYGELCRRSSIYGELTDPFDVIGGDK